MKKKIALISALFLLFMLPVLTVAQQMPQMPVDKDVRIGKLPNGLTYYIRHNNYPKGQADFYIAQKVGSILEEDNQRGLAHFLEHMCFNGTTHFPGKNLINWLESVGVKFGRNLNAYTSVDQTVYNMDNVPVAREGVQDSCLLILHDWANDLLLLPEEIDAERAVIHEEWRRSNVGQMRIIESLLPVIYPNTPYGHRLPIGTMEVVDNFPHQALRDYYEKWYRPDQQGIVVVGDVDVDRIESKIKEMFSDIEMPENPAERVYFPVPDTEGTIYAIGHDKEQTNNLAQLMIKTDAMPREMRSTVAYPAQKYVEGMVCSMLNTRLNDISSKPDAPFGAAGISTGEFFLSKTKDATSLFVLANSSDKLPSALAAAYREVLRAVKGGFTPTEYDRARSEYLSQKEKAYNNRDSRENNTFVQQYVDNFLDNTPVPPIEVDYETAKNIAASVTVEQINMLIKQLVTPDNRVVMAFMPDNAEGKYPTEEQFAEALKAVESENIEAFKEEIKSEPLIEHILPAGKVVSRKALEQWDATELMLSNGVRVIVKKTPWKKDEIRMTATALNGTGNLTDAAPNDIIFLSAALGSYGLGTYTNADLEKYLAGKQVSVRPSFSADKRTIYANTTPKDLPSMMEVLYSVFTQLNFTPDEFKALQNTYSGILHNQASNPQYIFQQKLYESLYKSPRVRALSVEAVEGASREGIIDIAHKMTANAADYTFTFVGNVDVDSLRPLLETYIASLPSDRKAARANATVHYNPELNPVTGRGTDTYTATMQTPQTWAYITQFGQLPYTMRDAQLASITAQILSKRLIDVVREKEGAVYSISAQGSMSRVDPFNTEIISAFPMKPEMKEKVLNIIALQFYDLTVNITPEELATVKEYMLKEFTEAKEKNASWLSAISGWTENGVDTFNGNIETLNSLTVDDVKAFASRLAGCGNYRVVILDPAATAAN